METMISNNKIIDNNFELIKEETIVILNKIWNFAKFNEYHYNRHPQYSEDEIYFKIGKLSKNQLKKLKKTINCFYKRKSLASANRFYHFLYSKVLESDFRIKLKNDIKREKISNKRKKYLELRKEMEIALLEYKQEKGNYFKLRLERGQKIE